MAVVFDIGGSLALFRKAYTTTSTVSFPFPPPTAVAGIIAAVVGLNHSSSRKGCMASYWESMRETKIALRIVKYGTIERHALNFWNTKNANKSPHIQVKHQFVRSPLYRIYVEGAIEDVLRQHLENETFIYTPYLGVAYALADITYVGRFEPSLLNENTSLEVDSVIPWNDGMSIDVVASGGAFKERMPFSMNTERSLTRTGDIVYAPSSEKKLRLLEKGGAHVTRCGEDTVVWFPAW